MGHTGASPNPSLQPLNSYAVGRHDRAHSAEAPCSSRACAQSLDLLGLALAPSNPSLSATRYHLLYLPNQYPGRRR